MSKLPLSIKKYWLLKYLIEPNDILNDSEDTYSSIEELTDVGKM